MKRAVITIFGAAALLLAAPAFPQAAGTPNPANDQSQARKRDGAGLYHDQVQKTGPIGQQNQQGKKGQQGNQAAKGKRAKHGPGDGTGNIDSRRNGPKDGTGYGAQSGKRGGPMDGSGSRRGGWNSQTWNSGGSWGSMGRGGMSTSGRRGGGGRGGRR